MAPVAALGGSGRPARPGCRRRRAASGGIPAGRERPGQRFGRTERMARAAADGRPAAEPSGPEDRAEILRAIMADLRLEALTFVARAGVEEPARHWLADARLAEEGEDVVAFALGEALALDVALFAPSASGTTAIDRLARQHRPADADERAALAAL